MTRSSTVPGATWRLWQLLDSAFPAGGFAHSGGLEAAWQAGFVVDASGVEAFARRRLRDLSAGPLVFARLAHQAFSRPGDAPLPRAEPGSNDPDSPRTLPALDRACGASLCEPVAHAASLRLGRGFFAAARTLNLAGLSEAEAALLPTGGHLPVAFGVVSSAAGVSCGEATRAFLFSEARAVFSAAVRLGVAGPLDSQARLAGLAETADRFAAESERLGPGDIFASSPLLPLLSGEQTRLYSKLFQS